MSHLCTHMLHCPLNGRPLTPAPCPQNVTWEGDNNVLCLQTARYLLKVG